MILHCIILNNICQYQRTTSFSTGLGSDLGSFCGFGVPFGINGFVPPRGFFLPLPQK